MASAVLVSPLRAPGAALGRRLSVSTSSHINALDGLRGLAILLVLAQHFTLVEKGIAIDRVYGAIGRFGWTGVDLFFVLSGFLITGILLNSRGQAHYFRNFYARRVLRIFPLYYVIILLGTVLLPLTALSHDASFQTIPATHLPFYWLFGSNLPISVTADRHNDFLGITWSLAIEEQFYLVWPLLVLLCRPRTLVRICVGLLGVSLLTRTGMVLANAPRNAIYVLTPCRLDAISLGSLIATLVHEHGVDYLRRRLGWIKAIGAAALAGIAGVVAYHKSTGWVLGPGQAVGYTFVALMYACLLALVLVHAGGALGRFFSQAWLRWLGRYSFAIYLVQMPIQRIMRDYIFSPDDFARFAVHGSKLPGQVLFTLMCLAPTLMLALASWHLLEKHALRLKRFFPTHPTLERPTSRRPSLPRNEVNGEAHIESGSLAIV